MDAVEYKYKFKSDTAICTEKCKIKGCRIGSAWCVDKCEYNIGYGLSDSGDWIKCERLDKAIGKTETKSPAKHSTKGKK